MISSILTIEKFKAILPNNPNILEWYSSLNRFLPNYNITTLKRIAAFLAQTAHESADYIRLSENLNYSATGLLKVWPNRFSNIKIAKQYEKNPEKIGNFVYGNRLGNGPVNSGDGYNYRGRGLIQLTGKANYLEFSEFSKISFNDIIKYLETFDGAVHSTCWFWQKHDLNSYSDKNDILGQTVKINGGKKGLADRSKRYVNYKKILYSK